MKAKEGGNAARRLIVIDDEPLAREGLVAMLARLVDSGVVPTLDVVAQCADAFAGIEAIQQHHPDIVLLDISMPELDGFAMLEQLALEDRPPAVIFITAFQQHAVKAFEVQAHDYLVKPVSESRLKVALEGSLTRLQQKEHAALQLLRQPPGEGYLTQLTIRELGYQIVVPVHEIDCMLGNNSYVRLHAGKTSRLLRERIHHLETALDPAIFFRSHRSAIVRLAAIRQIHTDSRYKATILLHSGVRVPLSRERKAGLEARLSALVQRF